MRGLQRDLRQRRQRLGRDRAEQRADALECGGRVEIPHHHEDRVVRRVPGGVELPQRLGGGAVEGRPRAERIVLIGGAGEHRRAQLLVELVARVGQVLRDLLFDRAALVAPVRIRREQILHAQGLDVQRDFQILGRHGEQELRQALARIGVEVATHHAADIRELVGREARTAAEHHVLERMRGARKPGRGFIRTDQVVDRGRDHRCERVAHQNDAQSVRQRRAQHPLLRCGVGGRRRLGGSGKLRCTSDEQHARGEPGDERAGEGHAPMQVFHRPAIIHDLRSPLQRVRDLLDKTMSVYDYTARSIEGEERSLAAYRGQALLIVNVASQCGFTPQYTGLEALYRKYRDRGFAVLGFPCDQFGHQEPGDEAQTAASAH